MLREGNRSRAAVRRTRAARAPPPPRPHGAPPAPPAPPATPPAPPALPRPPARRSAPGSPAAPPARRTGPRLGLGVGLVRFDVPAARRAVPWRARSPCRGAAAVPAAPGEGRRRWNRRLRRRLARATEAVAGRPAARPLSGSHLCPHGRRHRQRADAAQTARQRHSLRGTEVLRGGAAARAATWHELCRRHAQHGRAVVVGGVLEGRRRRRRQHPRRRRRHGGDGAEGRRVDVQRVDRRVSAQDVQRVDRRVLDQLLQLLQLGAVVGVGIRLAHAHVRIARVCQQGARGLGGRLQQRLRHGREQREARREALPVAGRALAREVREEGQPSGGGERARDLTRASRWQC
eukprot:scaffold60417_cov54-Phaeocystis_antarctica.AAC.3